MYKLLSILEHSFILLIILFQMFESKKPFEKSSIKIFGFFIFYFFSKSTYSLRTIETIYDIKKYGEHRVIEVKKKKKYKNTRESGN